MDASLSTRNPELLLAHADFVRALASKLVFDESSAQDVVQETWVSALQHPPRADRPLRAWLSKVAVNHALQFRRGERRRVAREEQSARTDGVPSTADIVEREAARKAVVEVVLALDEPYRSTILLRFYEDLPPRDVAKRLGVPVETVRTRTKRGLALLRTKLDRRYGDDREAWIGALLPLLLLRRAPWWARRSTRWVGSLLGIAGLTAGVWLMMRAPARDAAPARLAVDAPLLAVDEPPPRVSADRRAVDVPAVAATPTEEVALPTCSASGWTVDEQGQRLPFVKVLAYQDWETRTDSALTPTVVATIESDASGHFALEGLPLSFFLHAIDRHGRCAVAGLGATFAGSESIDDVQLRLMPSRTMVGRVVDEQGRPIAAAAIKIRALDRRGPGRATARAEAKYVAALPFTTQTDLEGRFVVSDVPAVKQYVSAESAGFEPEVHGVPLGEDGEIEFVLSPITEGDDAAPAPKRGRETTAPTAPLTGVVVDARTHAPIASYVLSVVARGESQSRKIESADGRFDWPAIQWSKTVVAVRAPGFAPWFAQLRGRSPHEAFAIELAPERELEVRVVDARGEPAAHSRLLCKDERGRSLVMRINDTYWNDTVVVGPDGAARLAGLPASLVRIEVRIPEIEELEPFEFDLTQPLDGVRELRLPCDLSSPRRAIELELELDAKSAPDELVLEVLDPRGMVTASARLRCKDGACELVRPLFYVVQNYTADGVLQVHNLTNLSTDSLVEDHGPRLEVDGAHAVVRMRVPATACKVVARNEGRELASAVLEPDRTRVAIELPQR